MTSDVVEEQRLHPAILVIGALRHARSAAVGMLAVIASAGLLLGGAIILGLLALALLIAVVEWRTTTYSVSGGTFRLRSGIVARKEQVVPASRISALDTSRGILQRIFGVVAVNLQIPGGKKADVTLHAVSFRDAERLRHELGHRTAVPATGTPVRSAVAPAGLDLGPHASGSGALTRPTFTSPSLIADDAPVVYTMSPRELLVAAVTSPSVAVVGAVAAAAFGQLQDTLPDRLKHQLGDSVAHLTVRGALLLVLVLLLVALVVSIAGTILLYGGFRITRDERRLRIRRGLVTERASTVPLDRVHGVRVVEAPLRQLLGYVSVEVEVAGYAGQDEVARTLIPLLRRAALPDVLPRVVPGYTWPGGELEGVPRRARRRYLTWPLLLFGLPLALVLALLPIGHARLVALLPPLLAVGYGLLCARDAGWLVEGDTLVLRARHGSRSTLLARVARLQRAELQTSPFQRRVALANFGVRLSNARGARVRHLDEAVVHALVARSGH